MNTATTLKNPTKPRPGSAAAEEAEIEKRETETAEKKRERAAYNARLAAAAKAQAAALRAEQKKPKHSDPQVASAIARLERTQAGYPQVARRPFWEVYNLTIALAEKFLRSVGALPLPKKLPSSIRECVPPELKGKLAAVGLKFRQMNAHQEKYGEPQVMGELERRREKLRQNPDAAEVTEDIGKEKTSIRQEFIQRRRAIREVFYREHGAELFRVHLEAMGLMMTAVENTARESATRDTAEIIALGLDDYECPDHCTISLCKLFGHLMSHLITCGRNEASYQQWLDGSAEMPNWGPPVALLELWGIEQIPLPL